MSLTGVANVSGNGPRSQFANSVLNHHDSRELHIDKATLERCLKDRRERMRRWRSQIAAKGNIVPRCVGGDEQMCRNTRRLAAAT